MNEAVEILKREREAASEQVRALKARMRGLDDAINLLEGRPALAKSPRLDGGDLKDKVLQLVAASGSQGVKPSEIAARLTNSGRTTGEASVSSTLSRLKADQKVRNQHGSWFAVNEAAPESANSRAANESDPDHQDDAPGREHSASGPSEVQSTPQWDDDLDSDPPF